MNGMTPLDVLAGMLGLRAPGPLDLLDVALATGGRLVPDGHRTGERAAKSMNEGHNVVLAVARTDLAKTNGAKTGKMRLVLAAREGYSWGLVPAARHLETLGRQAVFVCAWLAQPVLAVFLYGRRARRLNACLEWFSVAMRRGRKG
jgi:hypothetical protein